MKKYHYYLLFTLFTISLFATDRFALVIGNSNYSLDYLENTINDANDVSESFRSLGYKVTTILDGNRQVMESAVSDVSNNLTEDSMVVFYYAGHAAQIDKNNYLIPVNEDINNENDLKYKSVNLEWILGSFKSSLSRTNIIILDSCRDNPYKNSSRGSGTRGLSVISSPPSSGTEIKNIAIIYATTDGNTADDGDGRNSPFTQAFLKYIKSENETILDVMTYVTQDVFTMSGGKQEPTMTNVLKEKVYFFDAQNKIQTQTSLSKKTGLTIFSEINGEFFINGHFITYVYGGVEQDIFDIQPGEYELEFRTTENSEILKINLMQNNIIPIVFKNYNRVSVEPTDLINYEGLLKTLENDKNIKEALIKSLKNEINSIQDQRQLHMKYKDKRDQQRKNSSNAGFYSFLSYVGAGVGLYYSYENYQNSNNDISEALLIGSGGAVLVGVLNSAISKYNSKKVIEYDLQDDIFVKQIERKNRELKTIELEYKNINSQISFYSQTP